MRVELRVRGCLALKESAEDRRLLLERRPDERVGIRAMVRARVRVRARARVSVRG